jgi:hypothetical protein
VLDKGKSFASTADQRGAPRPFDFGSLANAAGGDGSDIGAFESGQPQLAIQQAGGAAILSWPGYYGGFIVEVRTNLNPPNVWNSQSGEIAVIANRNVFTNLPESGTRFYRLKGH